MVLRIKHLTVACSAGLFAMGALPASAAIYDIAASDGAGVEITLSAGRYRVEYVGIAGGGLYDAANTSCGGDACASGWTNAVSVRDSDFAAAFLPGGSSTVDVFTVGAIGSSFGSSAAALAAYRAGPINHYGVDIEEGVVGAPVLGETFATSPFVVQVGGDTYRFLVTDTDGDRASNQGGVSLLITAVPEPATWALMIGGFGLAGAALRRRAALGS